MTTTSTDITTRPQTTIGDVNERLAKAREFLSGALEEARLTGPKSQRRDGDYGKIPGCGDKPVLFKSGAEKLARLFDVEVRSMTRTLFEQITVTPELSDEIPGYMVAYTCEIAGPDGRVWGSVEAFASHEESTFQEFDRNDPQDWKRKTAFRGLAPLNTLSARAQKRAYVRALVQALGITSLVSTHDGATASEGLSEAQRGIIVALYEHTSPRSVDTIRAQATKIPQHKWGVYLRAALNAAADKLGWSDVELERAFAALDDEFASAATVTQLLDASDEVVDVEIVEAGDAA